METWRDVKGFEGYYEVSDEGRVKRLQRTVSAKAGARTKQYEKIVTERILKPTVGSRGYKVTMLCKDGKVYARFVHRLVAEAFIPNPENLATVNHKSLNKLDNCVQNLEWMSALDNFRHAKENGRAGIQYGSKNRLSKLTETQVQEIRRRYPKENGYALAREYGVSSAAIYDIIKGRNWAWLKAA